MRAVFRALSPSSAQPTLGSRQLPSPGWGRWSNLSDSHNWQRRLPVSPAFKPQPSRLSLDSDKASASFSAQQVLPDSAAPAYSDPMAYSDLQHGEPFLSQKKALQSHEQEGKSTTTHRGEQPDPGREALLPSSKAPTEH